MVATLLLAAALVAQSPVPGRHAVVDPKPLGASAGRLLPLEPDDDTVVGIETDVPSANGVRRIVVSVRSSANLFAARTATFDTKAAGQADVTVLGRDRLVLAIRADATPKNPKDAQSAAREVWLFDRAGKTVSRADCGNYRVARAVGRIYCESPAASYSVDIRTGERRPVTTFQQAAVDMLTDASPAKRSAAVQAILRTPSLAMDARVKESLLALLRIQLRADQNEAARDAESDAGRRGIRRASANRQLLNDAISAAMLTRDPRTMPYVAQADADAAPGALAMFGAPAFAPVEAALRAPRPAGYSMYFEARLLHVLRMLLEVQADLSLARREQMSAIAAEQIGKPRTVKALLEALQLAEDLDDESLDGAIGALAANPRGALEKSGFQPPEVAAVQAAAQLILSHRLDLRKIR